MTAAERDEKGSPAAKRAVEHSVGSQADQAEVIVSAVKSVAGNKDLAVGLQGQAVGGVIAAADRHDEFAAGAKGAIEHPIRVQADHTEVGIGAGGRPGDENLAVRLYGQA